MILKLLSLILRLRSRGGAPSTSEAEKKGPRQPGPRNQSPGAVVAGLGRLLAPRVAPALLHPLVRLASVAVVVGLPRARAHVATVGRPPPVAPPPRSSGRRRGGVGTGVPLKETGGGPERVA